MTEKKNFIAFEDGQVFLSQKELDDYRDQKIQAQWQSGENA